MKKTILTAAFMVCMALAGRAQNSLSVTLDDDLCLTEFTGMFKDNKEQLFSLGCGGEYAFDLADELPAYIIVNGVKCHNGEEADVTMDNHTSARVGYKGSKVTFGGGTTSTTK